MKRTAVLFAGSIAACSGGSEQAPIEPPPPPMELMCDMDAILASEGCANAGCHGVQHVGGVDLVTPGVAERLVGVASITDACRGRPLVDDDDPMASLLLELVDPSRPSSCGATMPFGAEGVAEEHVPCFEQWVAAMADAVEPMAPTPSDFEPAALEAQVSKVKTLLTGEGLEASDLDRVRAEGRQGLLALVDQWMTRPAFERKMMDFFEVALQQRLKGPLQFQLGNQGFRLFIPNLEQSFLRTAWAMVQRGEPFNRVATTRRWAVTTAVLAALRFTDRPFDRRLQLTQADFEPSDFEDWRFVELIEAGEGETLIDYRDLPTLRQVSSRIALRIPRVGYFTTPAFLANAETNQDNQFRVTTNQALIVGLGRDFDVADPTTPLTLDGLDVAHSPQGTPCFGCHDALDPMRLYFANVFDFRYRRVTTPTPFTPGFAFLGSTAMGGSLPQLGQAVADHPRFALAWAEKVCQWAASRACDTTDPELVRISELFASSNFDFRVLVREMVSSALVTGAAPTQTYDEVPFLVSITRQSHMCAVLDARLGREGVCDERALRGVLGLVPDDDFGRGKVEMVQTALTSAFHFAGVEQLCTRLSALAVAGRDQLPFTFDPQEPDATATGLVEGLMGLPRNHSRHDRAIQVVREHLTTGTAPASARLRSAFVLACVSADVTGVGL